MQKLKFMQEFTSAIIIEYLHSSLQAKLLLHNCARINHAKTCFYSILSNLKAQSSGKQVRMTHIYKGNKYRSMICWISKKKTRNDSFSQLVEADGDEENITPQEDGTASQTDMTSKTIDSMQNEINYLQDQNED